MLHPARRIRAVAAVVDLALRAIALHPVDRGRSERGAAGRAVVAQNGIVTVALPPVTHVEGKLTVAETAE